MRSKNQRSRSLGTKM